MNKDFNKIKLLSFDTAKQFKILYDLAKIIESTGSDENNFLKLTKYHEYLSESKSPLILKINKEFQKVKEITSIQFQHYIMNLERFLGQSSKEYQFLIQTGDHSNQETKSTLPHVCILDSIRSAHNVGAMIRNAECFGLQKIFLTGLTPKSDHPSVIKTAMGCEKIINVIYEQDCLQVIEDLKLKGFLIVGVETAKQASAIKEILAKKTPMALVFGHEQFGLSLDVVKRCDYIINLKMRGLKNSLNVAISQGIILNSISDQVE